MAAVAWACFETGVKLDETTTIPYYVENNITISGKKLYELSNHLGNVLAVIRDLKQPLTDPDDGSTYFNPTCGLINSIR